MDEVLKILCWVIVFCLIGLGYAQWLMNEDSKVCREINMTQEYCYGDGIICFKECKMRGYELYRHEYVYRYRSEDCWCLDGNKTIQIY